MMLQMSATFLNISGVISTFDFSSPIFVGRPHSLISPQALPRLPRQYPRRRLPFRIFKFRFCIFHNMAVVGRMDHCQSLSVITVGVSSKLMLHLVCLEVCQAPYLQDSISAIAESHIRLPLACISLTSARRRRILTTVFFMMASATSSDTLSSSECPR